MDIHDYKKRLEKVEKGIRNSSLSEKNKKIIGVISERLYKDIDVLEKEDIEAFLEWIQRKDITDWTKYTYKQVFKTFLKRIGKNNLAGLIALKTVRNKIPDIFTSAQMCEYFGWTQGSKMTQIYVHLSGRNMDDTLLKAYSITKENTPKEKDLAPAHCPRCGTVNGATGKFCYKCGAALDLVTAVNVDKDPHDRKS